MFFFVFLFVFLFVRSTISRQPAGRFTPKFACGRSLGRDMTSPLLGVGGPRRAEKGANEIFVTMGVNGKFLHFGEWRVCVSFIHALVYLFIYTFFSETRVQVRPVDGFLRAIAH